MPTRARRPVRFAGGGFSAAGVTSLVVAVAALGLAAGGAGAPAPPAAGPATPPLVLALAAYPTSGPAPLWVHFNLTVPNGTPPALNWSFGDGSYLNGSATTDREPLHVYDAAGQYTCSVEATWTTGSENVSTPIDVGASPNLTVAVSASPSEGVAPLTVDLNATPQGGSGTFVSYVWEFGDGTNGSGLDVRSTYEAAGHYRANFTIVDSLGDRANGSVWVNVTAPPVGNNSSGSNQTGGTPAKNGNSTGRTAHGSPPPSPPTLSTGGGNGPLHPASLTTPVALGILAVGLLALGGLAVADRLSRRALRSIPPPDPARSVVPTRTGNPPPVPSAEVVSVPTGTPRNGLTGGQQVTFQLVRYLAGRPRVGPGDLPDRGVTQAGIAEALGVERSGVSRVLSRLVAAGLVESTTGHVVGVERRVRSYRLTDRGERLGRALRESLPTAPRTPEPGVGSPEVDRVGER